MYLINWLYFIIACICATYIYAFVWRKSYKKLCNIHICVIVIFVKMCVIITHVNHYMCCHYVSLLRMCVMMFSMKRIFFCPYFIFYIFLYVPIDTFVEEGMSDFVNKISVIISDARYCIITYIISDAIIYCFNSYAMYCVISNCLYMFWPYCISNIFLRCYVNKQGS